ncbi:MAG: sel1 repeat family protein [Magnetococcales bacterium]|nr:sel1 repeat family protein [Magnetococcales bacterium]
MLPPTDDIDPQRYLALLRALAEGGNPKAQHNLGGMLLKGLGVERDPVAAAAWFERAALQGDPHAQHNLGVMCLQGIGMEKDPAQAAAWFRKAALQGDPRSAHALGMLHADGKELDRDPLRAYLWLSRALPGIPDEFLRPLRERIRQLEDQLDPDDLRQAKKRIPHPGAED